MIGFLENPMFIFWGAVSMISVVSVLSTYWYKTRKAEMDAELKVRMLEMGMSAFDIERVLNAESGGVTPPAAGKAEGKGT